MIGKKASSRRKAVLWDAVEQRKAREPASYAAVFAEAEASLSADTEMAAADDEIGKDIKRTFPWLESYASREAATRNVLLAYARRNPAVGYCQSLNFITGALLMAPLSEEDAFFALVTIVEDLLPPDYYSRDDDLLGARIDQLVFAELFSRSLPTLSQRFDELHVPLPLFSLQWFMCLFAKDLPLSLVLRVWDVMFVYGDHALFAVGLALLHMAESSLLECKDLESVYDSLKNIGHRLLQRDAEAAHRLVLHSLDTLMRTPLVERVEEGRGRHRREYALQMERKQIESYNSSRQPSQPNSPPRNSNSAAAAVESADPTSPVRREPPPPPSSPTKRSPASTASASAPVTPTGHRTRGGAALREEYLKSGAAAAPPRRPGDTSSSQSGGGRALSELLFFLRRNEMLLRQRREMLENKNAELRRQLAARGLSERRPATASFMTYAVAKPSSGGTQYEGLSLSSAVGGGGGAAGAEATSPQRRKDDDDDEDEEDGGGGVDGGDAEILLPPPTRDGSLLGSLGSSTALGSLNSSSGIGGDDMEALGWYDAVYDVQTIQQSVARGWPLHLSPRARIGSIDGIIKSSANDGHTGSDGWGVLDKSEAVRVGVLGLYNSGKTYVLNQLCEGLSLPSSRRQATRGVSVIRATLGGCLPAMLLDTEGSYAPVQAQQPGAMAARQETESLVEELIVRVCDYLVYVVDDFTSVDQRAVHRLAARLAERKQGFSELIVVHNLRTVADEVAFEHMWRTQILELYEEAGEELEGVVPIKAVNSISSASGSGEKRSGGGGDAAASASSPASLACRVRWFKTAQVRHLVLVKSNAQLASTVNPGSIALLRQWLHSAFVPPNNGRPSLFAQLMRASEEVFTNGMKQPMRLNVSEAGGGGDEGEEGRSGSSSSSTRLVRAVMAGPEESAHDAPRRRAAAARQAATGKAQQQPPPSPVDTTNAAPASPLSHAAAVDKTPPLSPTDASSSSAAGTLHLLPRSLSTETAILQFKSADQQQGGVVSASQWLPHVDLCEGSDAFLILVDVPSLSAKDLTISRSGAHTRVKGGRSPPYGDGAVELRGERLYGSFDLIVRVPEQYEKRWQAGSLEDGVLRLSYRIDDTEAEVPVS